MKVAVVATHVYSDKPPYMVVDTKYEFNEDLKKGRVIEIDVLNNATKCIVIHDLIKGNFGNTPHIYKWLNRPSTEGTIKKNHKVL